MLFQPGSLCTTMAYPEFNSGRASWLQTQFLFPHKLPFYKGKVRRSRRTEFCKTPLENWVGSTGCRFWEATPESTKTRRPSNSIKPRGSHYWVYLHKAGICCSSDRLRQTQRTPKDIQKMRKQRKNQIFLARYLSDRWLQFSQKTLWQRGRHNNSNW